MKAAFALILAAAVLPAIAQEPHKCKTASGFVYQDSPCKVQAPTKRSPPPMPSGVANSPQPIPDASPQNEAVARLEREKAYLADSAKVRRRADMKFEIERLEESILLSQQAMSSEITRLEMQKTTARNNLAGAVYLQSLSAEMQAVTSRHGIDISTKQDRVKKLREDLSQVQ